MSLDFTDQLADIHTFHNTTKHSVLVVKPWLVMREKEKKGERGREVERERKRERERERERCKY